MSAREDRDAADRDAAAEGLGVRGRDHRRPTTTRSMPGEVAPRARRRREARGPQRPRRPSAAWPIADLERDEPRRRRAGLRDQPADDGEPVGARRTARRAARGARSRAQRACRPRRRAGSTATASTSPAPSSRSPSTKRDVEAEPRGVRPRDGERVRARVGRRSRRGRGARPSAPARPRRCRSRRRRPARRAAASSAASTSVSVSGPRDQHAPVDVRGRCGGSPCAPVM